MGPEISTNIASILRAMENVIIPAIDKNQSLAREQAYLTVIYLRMIQEQHDKIFHFRLLEISEYSAILKSLLAKDYSSAAPDAAAAARQALGDASALQTVQLQAYDVFVCTARALREAADALVADLIRARGGDDAIEAEIASLLIGQAGIEALRERSWVAGLGLDPRPEQLQPLADLLRP